MVFPSLSTILNKNKMRFSLSSALTWRLGGRGARAGSRSCCCVMSVVRHCRRHVNKSLLFIFVGTTYTQNTALEQQRHKTMRGGVVLCGWTTTLLLLATYPMSSSSLAAASSSSSSSSAKSKKSTQSTPPIMKRILCLHGRSQSGAILSNKIAGARRKLSRVYELHFLDGPLLLSDSKNEGQEEDAGGGCDTPSQQQQPMFGWFDRDENGCIIHIQDALDYVVHETKGQEPFDAILGFSQGGTIATALAVSGVLGPGIKAVVTAGAPYVDGVLPTSSSSNVDDITTLEQESGGGDDNGGLVGWKIPKLHMAGATDVMVPVESTRKLCELAGNGELIIHDQGHLFPTRAIRVNYMMDFLERSLSSSSST